MKSLYITADLIGAQSGGGIVTKNEYEALASISEIIHPIDRNRIGISNNPFDLDNRAYEIIQQALEHDNYQIAHIYAGAFPRTVRKLKEYGVRVTYTAAAHDIKTSKEEHQKLGIPYNYEHINDKRLWENYLEGYLNADHLICPSSLSLQVMHNFGRHSRMCIIPHGTDTFKENTQPKTFKVGYLGAPGPDKGIIYLLEGWKLANLKDSYLIIAGNNTMILPWVRQYSGGNIIFRGFVDSISDFFKEISVYVQPSVTEGFGIEVLEAMAHSKPPIVTTGVGALDLIQDSLPLLEIRDPKTIAITIKAYHQDRELLEKHSKMVFEKSKEYSWDKIKEQYIKLWKELK